MSETPAARGTGQGLQRHLGAWSAGAILLGAIIGSGIFGVPADVPAGTSICRGWGAAGAIMILWLAGSGITLCAALSMSELAAMFPRAARRDGRRMRRDQARCSKLAERAAFWG